ncbi:MAG TPA: hypothetical protein VE567_00210 [Sphingomonas sp.]|nr:hypothetical protein [Sphingomonas sp.]
MNKLMLGLALVAFSAAPISARWTLMPETRVAVAKSGMTVLPGQGWNSWSVKPGKKGELWSYDGPVLNQIEFIGGVASGEPLARERNKKDKPLPKFSAKMLPTDIAQAYEQTQRIVAQSPDFTIESMEPVTFAGHPGVKFTYRFTKPDEELSRKGEARGAIVGGKLYMIVYTAPALYYFDAHLPKAQAIMDSAKIN